ncbi:MULTISPECIES: molybdopterin-containing oxidoreductase family protein [Thermomonospora]|uniref:Molybdopterin oxidoreductase n=1 Tax=Thermomonospora curvata (strain ATCC 19995 / DSM 43183 / JCM 3096 / KCTC 9072 / NBRC 15933 / NCIMB 10081 / Henssen B9) TaxID=471852 RepID=D1A3Y2_THECD|nr:MULTISPECIES: molybdopterin oxidoreductase family protein [Thermomonospora]ACY98035.1 molybdopterin oxidoreductase [Thermomonospora curvata DSM 43183]PKK14311.1 MAG: molybdopterin oxidoreductase family protein [Thermomonospora sp. CIF 1]
MAGPLKVLGACPLDCPDTCSWEVTVEDGRAVRLRGNPEHPFTRGALCTKVNRWLERAAAPDRILHPLRRVGRKGEGRFARISWDEALEEIAGRLRRIIDEHGGEAIWPYWGTGTLGWIQGGNGHAGRRLFNVLGASRHHYSICSIAGSHGLTYTTGTSAGIDPESLARAKLIILWGTNPLTSGHHLWKFVQDARKNGAYVVAIDPIRTRTARQADLHLAPLPGTDAALALGLMNVIVGLGAEDRAYLAARTLGWEEFRERIAQFPPQRVARITGLPEADIVALGERIARTRPTAIRATMGLQRHGGGGAALRALACLPAVTGDWALPGGGLSYSTDDHYPIDRAALFRDDLRPARTRELSMTRIGEALLEVDDPPVQALFVIAANPAASAPHQSKVRRGLAREDLFTVVLEQFPTDTVDYADIVLPATMQHEHADLHNGYGHLYLAWNEPAVPPPGECASTTETFRRLARHLGLEEPSLYASDEELAEQALSSGHPYLEGITLDRLRKEGFVRLSVPDPFVPFAEGFPTPSGKFEFFSRRAAAAGLDPLPGYVPPFEVADPERARRHPLSLISSASHHFLNTVFANNPELRRRAGEPRVVLHPGDAAARGITTGCRVRVFNDRGSLEAVAEVSDSVRPGVAATTKGHWPKLAGGANPNVLVDERDSDMGGGAVYHDTRVEITAL